MKRGEAQQSLIATNRWWRDPEGWVARDPDLRDADDAPFRYTAGVLSRLAPGGLYVLRGPRRVGKTVEVKRAIRELIAGGVEPRRIVHMAVDGLRSRDLGMLIDAAESLMPEGVSRFWFFDEITGITDGWPERIKWLRDNDPGFRSDVVALTGSSASDLTAATKALAGRRGGIVDSDRVLLPIGFRSFLRLISAEPPPGDVGPFGIGGFDSRTACGCRPRVGAMARHHDPGLGDVSANRGDSRVRWRATLHRGRKPRSFGRA